MTEYSASWDYDGCTVVVTLDDGRFGYAKVDYAMRPEHWIGNILWAAAEAEAAALEKCPFCLEYDCVGQQWNSKLKCPEYGVRDSDDAYDNSRDWSEDEQQ